MSYSKKAQWMDVIGPGNEMARTIGHMKPRKLEDMPEFVPPGAREAALITIFAREQDFAFEPVMKALEVLSKLEDWSHKFLVADKLNPHFNWKDSPFKKYASFADFYKQELEATWGPWTELQAGWAEVVSGKKSEPQFRAEHFQRIDEETEKNRRPHGGDRKSSCITERNDIQFDPSPTGTSSARAMRALRAHHPEIHAKVLSGELTPNGGMVAAGRRKPQVRPPKSPFAALAKKIREKGHLLTEAERRQLKDLL
jgi:hypothetical protein